MIDNPSIAYRPYVHDDRAFVIDTWRQGLRHGNSWFAMTEKDSYFKNYTRFIEAIIDKPTLIEIACLKDEPDVILGYVVREHVPRETVIHYIYVKPAWRHEGIARHLIGNYQTLTVTHLTEPAAAILKNHDGISFDPWILEDL